MRLFRISIPWSLWIFCLLISVTASAQSRQFSPDKQWLRKELKALGHSKEFIKTALDHYQEKTFETVLRLNLLGFLQPPQHMDRVTSQSVAETHKFVETNQEFFEQAEKKYKISPYIISALLWIETRHGEDRGRFHIVSVYLHLLQADRKGIRQKLTALALEKNKERKAFTAAELRKIMKERTKKRKAWAEEQLLALEEIHERKSLDLKTLQGSFAGAFGLAQFIPSSYRDYARATDIKANPNLHRHGDAIMSVAYYLKRHGWKNNQSEAQLDALMKYNNSRDYAESILEISNRALRKTGGGK